MSLYIENKLVTEEDIEKPVTFVPITGIDFRRPWNIMEGYINSFNEYYVFVNVEGELKTFFANNLRWGHLKDCL